MQGHNPRKGQGPWLKGISDTFPSIIPYVFLSTFILIKKKIFTYEYSGSPVRRVLPSCRPHSNCEALRRGYGISLPKSGCYSPRVWTVKVPHPLGLSFLLWEICSVKVASNYRGYSGKQMERGKRLSQCVVYLQCLLSAVCRVLVSCVLVPRKEIWRRPLGFWGSLYLSRKSQIHKTFHCTISLCEIFYMSQCLHEKIKAGILIWPCFLFIYFLNV